MITEEMAMQGVRVLVLTAVVALGVCVAIGCSGGGDEATDSFRNAEVTAVSSVDYSVFVSDREEITMEQYVARVTELDVYASSTKDRLRDQVATGDLDESSAKQRHFANLGDLAQALNAIEPPAELRDLHERRVNSLVGVVSGFTNFHDELAERTEQADAVCEEMELALGSVAAEFDLDCTLAAW